MFHPASGALEQARSVFLAGNGLPERWRDRECFVVLETGFGLGNNFLATWQAWRDDASRCTRLCFISIEQHPLTRESLATVPRDPPLRDRADELVQAWPPLTWNLHSLSFEGGRVQLLLALGDAQAWLPEIVASVDAFFLDGFAPAKNPRMWEPRLFKALGRLAATGATAATWSSARVVREGLQAAGFAVERAAGHGGKRDITLARHAPAFHPRRAPARQAPDDAGRSRHAVIVGAGLAGCATAWALAQHGWTSTLLDRETSPAQQASGNPAGLFHGSVNPQDGTHARFNRAAALAAAPLMRQAIDRGAVAGSVCGLLQLENGGAGLRAMQATLHRLGLPGDYVQALTAIEAGGLAGIPLAQPAWFYPAGGWIAPAGLCRWLLETAAHQTRFRGGVTVAALRRGSQPRWQLLDAAGSVIEAADTVVLANAGDARRLLDPCDWPLEQLRGQISAMPAERLVPTPQRPIGGSGYLLPESNGVLLFGATSQPGDDDPAVRDSDHLQNLQRLSALIGRVPAVPLAELSGRTAWRWRTDDRLPVIGAVPDPVAAARAARIDQPRFVPREPGLFVFTALGSRGITWAALGAQVLASTINGAPSPLEASLRDAIDPARFITRRARRAAGA